MLAGSYVFLITNTLFKFSVLINFPLEVQVPINELNYLNFEIYCTSIFRMYISPSKLMCKGTKVCIKV